MADTNSSVSGASLSPSWVGLRAMFYLVTPQESSFEHIEDVPQYVKQANPFFQAMVLLEMVILALRGQKVTRINDGISSVSAGMIQQLPHVFFRSIHIVAYIACHERFCVHSLPWESIGTWIFMFFAVDFAYYWFHRFGHGIEVVTYIECYERFNIYPLQWDSVWTWLFMMLAYDMAYYWFHRFGHEVNFMWAAHQTHHSSEEYNLTTALRQSFFQPFCSFVFYLPLSLFVPPAMFLVHSQFNLLYQFWIHTQVVGKLGPLEYILNTPSHHRVHHGRNRYCIDKNYAGTLIIWDRMFGTFAEEEDEVVYGLVHPINSWNPIYTQVNHWMYILETSWNTKGMLNKLLVFINGPGWEPGKPRLGNIEDIPDIQAPQPVYHPHIGGLKTAYTGVHFMIALAIYSVIQSKILDLSQPSMLLCVGFIVWTLFNVGALGENKSMAPISELLRCLSFFLLSHRIRQEYQFGDNLILGMYSLFAASALFVAGLCMTNSKQAVKQE